MNLIDSTYFINELALSGTEREATGKGRFLQTIEEQDLNLYIKKYQKEYLDVLLGASLQSALFDGLNLPDDHPDKEIWLALKNRLVNETEKTSPIANYVYYFVMRKGKAKTTPSGVKKAKSAHAENVSPMADMVFAWNEMAAWNREIARWLEENSSVYEKYAGGHSINREDDLFIPEIAYNL
jgi:hypothetical protein